MTIENAIDHSVVIVEYDVIEQETSEKMYAVFGVLDRKGGKRLPFDEAVEKGMFISIF